MAKSNALDESKLSIKMGDPWIWGIYVVLCLCSLIEDYSASSQEILTRGLYAPLFKQCFYLICGFLLLIFLRNNHYLKYTKWILPFTLLTLACLIYTALWGKTVNGAKRAIDLVIFTIQPAEMAKIAVVLQVSRIIATNQVEGGVSAKGFWLSIITVGTLGAAMVMQGLTNTIIMVVVSLGLMLVGGCGAFRLFKMAAVLGVVVFCLLVVKESIDSRNDAVEMVALENRINTHQYSDDFEKEQLLSQLNKLKEESGAAENSGLISGAFLGGRFTTWVNRVKRFKANHDSLLYYPITPINLQETYAHMAQAHGGPLGVGLGNSRESSRLPLAYSDYIYSIIIEESGLWGGIGIIFLFLSLIVRAGIIAGRCRRAFPALLILGMALMISFQALIHIAINTGLFPVSGQALPLISKGGTSILVISAAFGIMLSVSRYASDAIISKARERGVLDDSHEASNPSQWSDKKF